MLRRDSNGWYIVQISARIVDWPSLCACCCGHPNTAVEVSSSRVKGVKIVRTETKAWSIPYCVDCLRHIELTPAVSSAQLRADEAQERVRGYRPPWVLALRPLLLILGPFLGIGLYAIVFNFGLKITSDSHARVLRALFSAFLASLAATGYLVFCILLYRREAYWYPARRQKAEVMAARRRAELTEHAANLQKEADRVKLDLQRLLRNHCPFSDQLTVAYDGWEGTIHTFRFASNSFAEAFVSANRKKIL